MSTYETKEIVEKVVLLGVDLGDDTKESMKELAEHVDTAGATVLDSIIQSRERIHPGTYIGKGKIEEVKDRVIDLGATGVVCDDELTPAQLRNLEDLLDTKVMDRTMVILDIFAKRATTSEGKIQVELAQLKFSSARLVGLRSSLSRLGGGIGTRGPGEKKLEIDRRLIHERISQLKAELKKVENHRDLIRKSRDENLSFNVAIVGYTNAGKSTLLNKLTDANILAEDKLFATLDPTTRKLKLGSGQEILVTDTVGFIRKLPHHLIEAFKSTLEESKNVDLLVHVIDASNPNHEEHEKTVLAIMKDLDMLDIPRLTLYNKADKVENFTPTLTPYVLISAKNENSRAILQNALLNKMRELFVPFRIKVSPSKAYKLHELESLAIIDKREYLEESETISGYIAEKNKWRLEEFYD